MSTNGISVIWVNKEDAVKIWPMVEPFLISAMKRWLPVYFSSDLLEGVLEDKMQLWIITNNKEERLYGAALTQIIPYPRAKILNLFLLGGQDMKSWKDDMSNAIETFARSQGCDFLQSLGRRGWAWFKGAFESAVVVNKVLT